MKNKLVNKKVISALSIGLSVAMTMQPMTAFAAPEEPEEPMDATSKLAESDQDVKDNVKTAQDAAKAADTAAEAAEVALKAANELVGEVNKAKDAGYDEVVSADELNDENENTVTEESDEAATELANANEAAETVNNQVKSDLAEVVSEAEASVAEQYTAATDAATAAEAAKDVAQTALEATKAAEYKEEALEAAADAEAAAEEAAVAADEAKDAYEAAVATLEQAKKDYEKVVAEGEIAYGEATAKYNEELKEAEDAIKAAQAAVDALEAEYNKKVTESTKAADYAVTADAEAKKAANAAKALIDKLEALKGTGELETLEANVAEAEGYKKAAEDNKTKVDTAQNAIITERTNYKNEQQGIADAKDAVSKSLQNEINELEKNIVNQNKEAERQQGIINANSSTASKSTSDVKYSKKHYYVNGKEVDEWAYDICIIKKWKSTRTENIYYSAAEIQEAKNAVNNATAARDQAYKYAEAYGNTKAEKEAAKKAADEAKATADGNVIAANNAIVAANQAKTDAQNAVNNATNALAARKSELAVLSNYIYSADVNVLYTDRDEQAKFIQLMQDIVGPSDKLKEIRKDVNTYEDSIDYDNFWQWCAQKLWPLSDEYKIERKYRDWDWHWSDGETHVFKDNDSNLSFLIDVRDDQLRVVKVEEAEFATFCGTFDKVAAAQAAARAAQAAADEKAAFEMYNAALKELNDATDKLNELKLNAYVGQSILDAERALVEAQGRAYKAEAEYHKAVIEKEAAQQAALDAKEIADGKKSRPTRGGEDGGDNTPDYESATPVENGNAASALVAAAPANTIEARVAAPAVNIGGGAAVEIADDNVALAPAPEKTTEPATTEIADEDTALAQAPIGEESISWWWLLIIAAFGAAGYALYKKSREKKLENTEE